MLDTIKNCDASTRAIEVFKLVTRSVNTVEQTISKTIILNTNRNKTPSTATEFARLANQYWFLFYRMLRTKIYI